MQTKKVNLESLVEYGVKLNQLFNRTQLGFVVSRCLFGSVKF